MEVLHIISFGFYKISIEILILLKLTDYLIFLTTILVKSNKSKYIEK